MGTLKKLHKMRTLKFGTLIGVDKYGNKYYENRQDYIFGQHRWVEYAGEKNFYEVDASNVPAEWHVWLHSGTAEPPTNRTTGSVHRVQPVANAWGSSAPYERNLGGVINEHTPNLSSFRPRGYNLGNGLAGGSKPNEELYYTQPGFPMDKRNSTRRAARASRIGWTLADTPLTLRAKEATRAGVSLEEYEQYTNPESATNQALVLMAKGVNMEMAESVATASRAEMGALDSPLMDRVNIPADPKRRQLALRLATGTGHSRPELEEGTFAAARTEVLSAEDEAFLSSAPSEDGLLGTIAQYQDYIDSYATVKAAAVQEAVEEATRVRDAAIADLERVRALTKRLEALEAKFDARAYEEAAAFQKRANM